MPRPQGRIWRVRRSPAAARLIEIDAQIGQILRAYPELRGNGSASPRPPTRRLGMGGQNGSRLIH